MAFESTILGASGGDASEADAALLEQPSAVAEPLDDDERAAAIVLDAAQPLAPAGLAQQWLAVSAKSSH